MSAFTDLLVDPYAERTYLAEITVYDKISSSVRVLYFVGGSRGFVTGPGDSPSNQFYEPRLEIPLIFSQSLYSEGKFGGSSIPGYGSLTLVNDDGGLDDFRNYAVDGRRLIIKLGSPRFSYSDFGTVFDGTMASIEFDNNRLIVRVRDLQHKLSIPMQQTLYGGTGGWDGTTDIQGKPKPHCFGRVRNLEPVLVDPSNLRYQIHYTSMNSIDSVRDKGAALTNYGDYASLTLLDAASIPAGYYATCLAQGCFKLGSSPVGVVTADAVGDSSSPNYSDASSLLQKLASLAGITTLDTSSLASLKSLCPSTVGIYKTEETEFLDAMDEIANSVGAWYSFTRNGEFTVGRIDPPSGTSTATFTAVEILDFSRNPTVIPNWRIKVGYRPNLRTLSQSELAAQFLPGGVNASQNGSLTEEYRFVSSEDSSVKTAHLLAVDQEVYTRLDDKTDAQAEATRLLNMFKVYRDVYTVKVKTQPLSRRLGEIVTISYSRYGLSSGKQFVIVGLVEDYVSSTVEMELWG